MNTELIGQHWDGLGDKEIDLVTTFYERLFARHPRFRTLFPEAMDRQTSKMVQTLALMAKHSDGGRVIDPHLQKVGVRHREYALAASDFEDFLDVLMEVMSEYNTQAWSPRCESAWREVFHQVLLPAMVPVTATAV